MNPKAIKSSTRDDDGPVAGGRRAGIYWNRILYRALTPRGSVPKKHVKDFSVNCLNGDINDNFLGRFNYFSFSLALSLSPGHRQLHNFSAANPKSFALMLLARNGNAKENFLSSFSCGVEEKVFAFLEMWTVALD